MPCHAGLKIIRLLLLAILIAGIHGCGDDDVTGTGSGVPRATIENIWPNEDGRSWEFLLTSRSWFTAVVDSAFLYPDSTSVPAAPALSAVLEWVDSPHVPEPNTALRSSYEFRFTGTRTTPSGVEGQNLEETRSDLPDPVSHSLIRAVSLCG